MGDDRLRVAIIGAGMIANVGHIPAWRDLGDEVEVVAVASLHMQSARGTAERHEIPLAYDDPQRMLDETEPDIVSICTPNVYHREWALAAFRSGAHVLCEKPIATSYADAVEMYRAAESAGKILFVGQSGRFSGEMRAAKELVDAGSLGEIYYAEASALRRRGVPTWGKFHMKEHSGGGPLYDLGVHVLDAVLWIMGNPLVVSASGVTYAKLAASDEDLLTTLADSGAPVGVFTPRPYDWREFDVEEMAVGFLRLENGGSISIKASWAANVADGTGGTFLLGTKGGLHLRPLRLIGTLGRYQVDATPKIPEEPSIPFYGPWRQAAHFVNVIRGHEDLIVSRDEVLNVIRALEGLYRSAREGREVSLDG